MEADIQTLILLPVGLGLLGFIEPCTIGAHLVFMRTLADRPSRPAQIGSLASFVAARTVTSGAIGIVAAFLGQALFTAQTTIWMAFGIVYLLLGIAYCTNQAQAATIAVRLAPAALRRSRNPAVLGAAFALNVPACAAPILFGLLGVAATAGSLAMGFWVMALFGAALSLPLVLLVALPGLSGAVDVIARDSSRVRLVLGAVFIVLGLWSVWFSLYVDPTAGAEAGTG